MRGELGKSRRDCCLETLKRVLHATLIRLRVKVKPRTNTTEATTAAAIQARLGQRNAPHVIPNRDTQSVLDVRMALPGTIRPGTSSGPFVKETNAFMTIAGKVSSVMDSAIVLVIACLAWPSKASEKLVHINNP